MEFYFIYRTNEMAERRGTYRRQTVSYWTSVWAILRCRYLRYMCTQHAKPSLYLDHEIFKIFRAIWLVFGHRDHALMRTRSACHPSHIKWNVLSLIYKRIRGLLCPARMCDHMARGSPHFSSPVMTSLSYSMLHSPVATQWSIRMAARAAKKRSISELSFSLMRVT